MAKLNEKKYVEVTGDLMFMGIDCIVRENKEMDLLENKIELIFENGKTVNFKSLNECSKFLQNLRFLNVAMENKILNLK